MSLCRWGLTGFGLRLENRCSAVGELVAAGSAGGACFLPRLPVPLVRTPVHLARREQVRARAAVASGL